jgi:uncharacterized protein
MATTYKTPGVYVEEITKFPPSVAQVETAIPAFIGYTAKADSISPGDLKNVPTKIGSLLEYETYFGGPSSPTVGDAKVDDANNFVSATVGNVFYMYDTLRLFYANGGGDCYIVSVNKYADAQKAAAEFTDDGKGLKTLEKVDEPTILVFPDNSLLTTGNDYYDVYTAALSQCEKLGDRVGLFDVKEGDPKGAAFRSGIGINNLKYGAAYTPWLKVNFPKEVKYRDFKDNIFKGASKTTLAALNSPADAGIQTAITELEQVIVDVNTIKTGTNTAGSNKTLRDRYTELENAYNLAKSPANFRAIMSFLFGIARQTDAFIGAAAGSITNAGLKASVTSQVGSSLVPVYVTLAGYDKEAAAKLTPSPATYATTFNDPAAPANGPWAAALADPAAPATNVITGANNNARMDSLLPLVRAAFETINNAYLGGIVNAASKLEKDKEDGLAATFPTYKAILTGIRNTSTTLPPCGAVAGLYAMVDRTRGVWKAPANVSVSNVIGPKDSFTASELDALNVDVNGGKSINAIRSFTGKGTLVFGARTLAGNDNEWRYVSVRRFFNMVEESVKKATEQFVFEPNDANTWTRVRAMIENYLTILWRQGALAGAKPEHAFYVACGLGATMTPQDILEGRMIVEIGMAAVRPAEFIILRFSHKMQES